MPSPIAARGSSTAARNRLPNRVRASTSCSAAVSRPQITMIISR
jgi:hypothetical protein